MRPALVAALCVAMAACAPADRSAEAPEPATLASRLGAAWPRAPGGVMAYLGELRGLSEPALGQEIVRQRQLLSRDRSDLTRTRLALALSLSPQGEDGEIMALVEPVAKKENAAPEVRAMASFLHVMAGERRRLRESAAAANTKLREERKAAESQKHRADTMQERAAQLQQKLDALTELEKSLSDRPISTR